MLQAGQRLHFGLDKLVEGLVLAEDLDGEASVCVVLGELDLAADAAAELSAQGVLSEFRWHSILFLACEWVIRSN